MCSGGDVMALKNSRQKTCIDIAGRHGSSRYLMYPRIVAETARTIGLARTTYLCCCDGYCRDNAVRAQAIKSNQC